MVNITGVCQIFVCHIFLDEKVEVKVLEKEAAFEYELFSLFFLQNTWLVDCVLNLYVFFQNGYIKFNLIR